ncbi:MAG TPA: heme ABC exporter ATP-binding protein CcmA [Candidatus Polarisedimenticolaceae bacterium]|nr:heme ABC exporter ATP-binding protein CcmA [Candidatus Polarisedimenticolaceae bacterium]
MTTPSLAARGLTRRFGAREALSAFDLTVGRGEAVALFGGNGAGKTTLLKLAAGLLRATSGSVEVEGKDPRKGAPSARAAIGYLAHRTLLYDDLTPFENVRFAATMYGLPDPGRSARDALDAMDLAHRADDPVRTLSRGLQQRAALARALVHRPRLLLLDEPTTGLDRDAAARIVAAVRDAVARGAAAIVATHDVEAGLAASPRWIVLDRGRAVASGDASRGERP